MVQKILNAVTKQIDTTFGYERIFTDEVEQGVELPYAFVTVEPSPRLKLAGDRYSETTTVSVIIEIADDGDSFKFDELRSIGSQLQDVLEYITLSDGDKLRGENSHIVIQEGYIDFTIDYSYFIRKIKEADEKMLTATTNVVLDD